MYSPCQSKESNRTESSTIGSKYYSSLTMCGYSYQNANFFSVSDDADFIEVDNVRISPAATVFRDAFEGRHYKEKIVIQNCGKNTAFIRICAPSSYAFKIKTIPYGQYLSPGLRITRIVSYTHHQKFSAPISHIPIYINYQYLKYKLSVSKSSAIIYAQPHYLDFGTVNADSTPFSKMLILTNDGTKSSRFAVDVGSNKLQMVVKPMQGMIQPKSSISLRVEIMCHEEGTFIQELWIKCETPFRVHVSANFIFPKLKVFCANSTLDFTFFDFPRTYFGASCTRFLVIKNDSAVAKMFCIMAEVDKDVMTMKEALKKRQDFRCFHMHPIEGRLQPHEGRVIEIVFAPKNFVKSSASNFHDDYAICYVRVIQINTVDLPGGIVFKETHEHARIPAPYLTTDEDVDSLSISLQDEDDTYSSIKLAENVYDSSSNVNFAKDFYRRICLHGECEKVDLSIQPDSLTLFDLRINQEERRVLSLKNSSKYLKFNFRYKKCPGINIDPNEGVINSLSTLEVSVHICPSKTGHVHSNICFQILYQNLPENTDVVIGEKFASVYYSVNSVTTLPKPKFNMGITPQITNEVGILTDDVRFNSPVQKPIGAMVNTRPKQYLDNDLIAFPNDRPLTLRPWTSQIPCKTIFAGIPRPKTEGGIDALSKSERETKKLLYVHYNDYIRRKRSKKIEPVTNFDDDYDIGDGHSLLMENVRYKCANIKEKKEKSQTFMSMTPTELYKIKIDPHVIDFGKVAVNSLVSKWFQIKNENVMPVRVFLECHHNSITFKNGRRLVMSPQSNVSIHIEYKASENGRFIIPIRVIFNECHFSQVILLLEAVEKYVEINVVEVHFYSDDLDPKHLDVRNPLNAPVKFRWEVPKSCFSITPMQGTIQPKMIYPCLVTFNTHPTYDIRIDVILILENNANITVPIWVEMVKPDVILERDAFMIHAIPLNQPVRRKFVLRNNSYEPISIAVLNPQPAIGISLFPPKYVLHGKSEMNITVELKIDAYVNFNCEVQLELQRLFILDIAISGEVEFPYISIEPHELIFNKLSVGATQCLPFYIKNQSKSLVDITLNFKDFPEFSISEKHLLHPLTNSSKILLESLSTKKLYLHFTPNDVTYYNFLLPFVINGLIGPPVIDDDKSLLPDTYYTETQQIYIDHNKSVVEEITKPLDAVRIDARANTMMLAFSSLEYNFCYFPNNDYESVIKHTLEISNISDRDIKICMRTYDFGTNYSMVALSDENNTSVYKNSCVCCLKANASITYKISFHPMIQGTYDAIIPVTVRDVNEELFNYINLHGVYPVPSIETQLNIIYLRPVPLGCVSKKTITLKTSYHMNDCSIKADISSCDLLVDFTNANNEVTFKKVHNELQVNISFKSFISVSKREKIKFSCTCPAECTVVVVTCSENNVVTNHAFLEKCSFKNVTTVFTPFIFETNFEKAEDFSHDLNDDSSSSENTPKTPEDMHVFDDVISDNEDSYPFFPVESDESENAQYMRRCLSALENWVYEQCFYSMSYYSIPNGIASNPVSFENNQQKNGVSMTSTEENRNDKLLPFLQLLKNLGGNSIDELIPTKPLPEDHHERIVYLYTIYNKILNFLMNENARLMHVQAEYLLKYDDYVDYKQYLENHTKSDVTKENILDEDSFCSLTKQYWMDIILQTFKIFVLSRIQLSLRERVQIHLDQKSTVSFKTHSSSLLSTYNASFVNFFKEAHLPTHDIYSTADLMLLSWLEYNFEKQRKILWPNHTPLQPRHVQHFDEDLKDGIILACLTAQHCPYLSDCFQEFFLQPKTHEELIFNAIRLTDVWRTIHISFHILPDQIVKPNRIQMLLFVTYLYDFLPSLIPKESLTLIAKHTLSIQETVRIKNKNDNVISYRIKLFSNYPQFFNISKTNLVIKPHKDCSLTITFHARKLIRVFAVLILCGDTPGYKYAKSIVIKVEGIPDVTYVNGELTFEENLYQMSEKPFSVFSPYKEEAIYDMYYYPRIPDHIDELKTNLLGYQTLKDLKLPRRFHNKANQIKCDADGVANTFAVYCGFHPRSLRWITYYCNNEVGDFSTKTNVIVDTTRTVYETIYVRLPRGLSTLVCQCRKLVSKFGKCPRDLNIEIPRKNNLMWACIKRMFYEVLSEEDIPFWTKYLETSAGNHIMKYMFDSERNLAPRDIKHIFNKSVTYKVMFDRKTPPTAELPKEITIDDVLTEGVFSVSIHLNTDKPKDFYFNMVSADQSEIRYYKIEFLPEL